MLFDKIIPGDLYEEWESTSTSIEMLESDSDIIRFKELADIPYKDKSKDERLEFKKLKSEEIVNEYNVLLKGFKALDKRITNNADMKKLESINAFVKNNPLIGYDNEEGIVILRSFLKDYFPESLSMLNEIIERAYDEIIEISKQDYPDWVTTKAQQHQLGYGNSWWIFGEVSKHFNNNVFYAEAEHLGYKRTSRSRQDRPNELYACDDLGNIIINKNNPQNILDMIKSKGIWT